MRRKEATERRAVPPLEDDEEVGREEEQEKQQTHFHHQKAPLSVSLSLSLVCSARSFPLALPPPKPLRHRMTAALISVA